MSLIEVGLRFTHPSIQSQRSFGIGVEVFRGFFGGCSVKCIAKHPVIRQFFDKN